MASPTGSGAPPLPRLPRQRWRIAFGRGPGQAVEPHRAVSERIEEALAASGLPLVPDPRRGERPRLAFGAPLPVGVAVDRDLFDLWLTELRPFSVVRRAAAGSLPDGYRLVDAYDVWLGAPALAASVVGAIYAVELQPPEGWTALLDAAVRDLLAAASAPRTRTKGSGDVTYDLRPLIEHIALDAGPAGSPAARLTIHVRFDPALGSGRPDEVVAALSERMDLPLGPISIRRQCLVLSGPD